MPVDLKNIPKVNTRPVPPKFAYWMVALIALTALNIFISRLLTGENNEWLSAVISTVIIGGLLLILFLIYLLRQIFANARNKQREKTIIEEIRRGRRALRVLAAESCTAHSSTDSLFSPLSSYLLNNENVFFSQYSWRGEENIRLSQLARPAGIREEQHFEMLLVALAQKLAVPMAQLPVDKPVMLLLESSSSIPEEKIADLWRQAWLHADIQQSYFFTSETGLQVIDNWLDHHIRSDAYLLVVSWQYAPENTAFSAETISGVLLGNRLAKDMLPTHAILHRPEAGSATPEKLHYAIQQALDWVPVSADKPQHLWITGVGSGTDKYISLIKAIDTSDLDNVEQHTGIHNFNDFLGDPGKAGVWLAVVAATQSMQQCPAHHLLISSEQQNEKLWSMVVSPAPTMEGEA